MKNVLFIANFNDAINDVNTWLSKDFNMQKCPAEPDMIEVMLTFMKIDMIVLYLSGIKKNALTYLWEKRAGFNKDRIPVVAIGTNEDYKMFGDDFEELFDEEIVRPVIVKGIAATMKRVFKDIEERKYYDDTEIIEQFFDDNDVAIEEYSEDTVINVRIDNISASKQHVY